MYHHRFKFLYAAVLSLLLSCNKAEHAKVERAIYYWKSKVQLHPEELKFLKAHQITRLYIKYFDVVWDHESQHVKPVSIIEFKQKLPAAIQLIPVIYMSNESLLKLPKDSIHSLGDHIISLVNQCHHPLESPYQQIQLDCDWTLTTRTTYFDLLHYIKQKLSGNMLLSATIRLHQIKYAGTTGIPPVDRGMLMYYNLGSIQSMSLNSIFNDEDASKYAPYIKQYPLSLDAVLPVFSWVKVFRNGKLIHLFNSISLNQIKSLGQFTQVDAHSIKALSTAQIAPFYMLPNDVFVEEHIGPKESMEAAQHLHRYFKPATFTLSLFHLHQQHFNEFTFQDIEDLYTAFN